MTDHHQRQPGISRRQLTHGAAWTVPAIAVSAGAPAMAASPVRVMTAYFFAYYEPSGGRYRYRISQTPSTAQVCMTNMKSTDKITEMTMINYFYTGGQGTGTNVTWTRSGSTAGTCWSIPTVAGYFQHPTNRLWYTGYLSTYTCALVATNGTWCLPRTTASMYNFVTPYQFSHTTAQMSQWKYTFSFKVNGTSYVKDTPFGTMV